MSTVRLITLAAAGWLLGACAVNHVPVEYAEPPADTAAQQVMQVIDPLLRKGAIRQRPDWREHVITADKRGKFEERMFHPDDPCRRAGGAGAPTFGDCQLGRVLNALDKAIDAHFANGAKTPFRLLLSIHGGLVGETAAVEQAKAHLPLMRADGVYPVFLNWHTGGVNSYGDQVVFVRNGERIDNAGGFARAAHVAATPLHVATDIAEGLVRAPVQWASQLADLESDVEEGDPAPGSLYDGAAWGAISGANNLLSAPGNVSTGELASERLHYFLTSPFKIATMPLVDGIGKPAWDKMLRRSRAVLRTDDDFRDAPARCQLMSGINRACYDRGSGAFARVLGHLERLVAYHRRKHAAAVPAGRAGYGGCAPIGISLVAHSMGAIVANDILRDFDLGVCNIVFMAAASSIRHFYNTTLPYIERHPGVRFYNMMLHPTNDQREDYAWGLVPEGSLLVWIDSFYEESDSVFDRTLGKWQNVGRTKRMFSARAQRCMFFKVFGIKGAFPTGHGAFNDVWFESAANDGPIAYAYNYWQPRFWGHPDLGGADTACR
jgi:hypothetical protein